MVVKFVKDHCLIIKEKNYEFNQTSLFLGYRIHSNWVEIDEEKVRAIREWPHPKMVKELQQFLGFSNFHQYFMHGSALWWPT